MQFTEDSISLGALSCLYYTFMYTFPFKKTVFKHTVATVIYGAVPEKF